MFEETKHIQKLSCSVSFLNISILFWNFILFSNFFCFQHFHFVFWNVFFLIWFLKYFLKCNAVFFFIFVLLFELSLWYLKCFCPSGPPYLCICVCFGVKTFSDCDEEPHHCVSWFSLDQTFLTGGKVCRRFLLCHSFAFKAIKNVTSVFLHFIKGFPPNLMVFLLL